MENKNSSWLYLDSALKNPVTTKNIEAWQNSNTPHYFYDGNNGDKHLFTGYFTDGANNENIHVLGVSMTQCHLAVSGFGNCFANANKAAEAVSLRAERADFDGKALLHMLRNVRSYGF